MSKTIVLEIPYGVSLDGLLEVIASWNRADAVENAQSANEIADKAEYKAKTIERQLRFLLQLGFIEKYERKYRLTAIGSKFSKLVDYEQNDQFFEEVREILLGCNQLRCILDFVAGMKSVDKEKLVSRIVMHSERPSRDKNAKMGAEALLDLLEQTGLVEVTENQTYTPGFFDIQQHEESERLQKKNEHGLEKNEVIVTDVVSSSNRNRVFLSLTLSSQVQLQWRQT